TATRRVVRFTRADTTCGSAASARSIVAMHWPQLMSGAHRISRGRPSAPGRAVDISSSQRTPLAVAAPAPAQQAIRSPLKVEYAFATADADGAVGVPGGMAEQRKDHDQAQEPGRHRQH